jgi:hypothetical protein
VCCGQFILLIRYVILGKGVVLHIPNYSHTPVQYAAFLTMSPIKMFGFNCNSVLYTSRILCFSDALNDFLFGRFLGGLKIFVSFRACSLRVLTRSRPILTGTRKQEI